ncbi:MAG TPA: AI-2E family transporter [Pirellulaceae bacterium]|nr:AI-2E family transporter [Pirellulaceae bacterium]
MHEGNENMSDAADGMLRLAKRTATVCAVAALMIIILLGIASAIDVVLIIFIGVLFAIVLHSLAKLLGRYTGMGEKWSLFGVVVLLLLLTVAGGWLLVPKIATQVEQFRQEWPESLANFRERMNATPWGSWLLQVFDAGQFLPQPQAILSRTAGAATSAFGLVGVLLMVCFLGLMLAAQPQVYQQGLLRLILPAQRVRGRKILGEIGSSLQWFLSAKAVAMVVVGVVTWLGLLLLGIELAATLAIVAGLLTFIPNFGPIISAVPAVLLGLMHGPLTALWVVLLFIAIQLIESYLVTPLIQYRALSLPPVLVIAAQLGASVWMGVLGLVVATPLLIVAMVLVRNLYLEGMLQEGASASASEGNSP